VPEKQDLLPKEEQKQLELVVIAVVIAEEVIAEEVAEAAEEASVTEAAEEAVAVEEEEAQVADSVTRITGLHLPSSVDW
jgi:hypothetical protein